MYSINKQYRKFLTNSDYALTLLEELRGLDWSEKKSFLYMSGIVNFIWQIWGSFFRTFWLTHLLGGRNYDGTIIPPKFLGKSEEEILYFVNYLLKRNVPISIPKRKLFRHQEPTWGDIDKINTIASKFKQVTTTQINSFCSTVNQADIQKLTKDINNIGNTVLDVLSVLGNSPKHLQIVRNSSIHFNEEPNKEVMSLVPYYRIKAMDLNYPTDIIFAQKLDTGKEAIKVWLEEMVAFIEFLGEY